MTTTMTRYETKNTTDTTETLYDHLRNAWTVIAVKAERIHGYTFASVVAIEVEERADVDGVILDFIMTRDTDYNGFGVCVHLTEADAELADRMAALSDRVVATFEADIASDDERSIGDDPIGEVGFGSVDAYRQFEYGIELMTGKLNDIVTELRTTPASRSLLKETIERLYDVIAEYDRR